MIAVEEGSHFWRVLPKLEPCAEMYASDPGKAAMSSPVEYQRKRMIEDRQEIHVFTEGDTPGPITQLVRGYQRLRKENEALRQKIEDLEAKLLVTAVISHIHAIPGRS